MARFALIGAAGYIAPRHMRAMKAVGGDLVVAYDPNDSVGVIDSHFPDAHFFTEFERFDRHVDKLRRSSAPVTHMAICSPNYLHDAHCRFALRAGSDAICEKPLVLNPWNLDGLAEMEHETGRKISTILQLRLHPTIQALKARIAADPRTDHEIELTYITSRGRWYHASWKADEGKSGGIATNIGVHFFDMMIDVFGPVQSQELHHYAPTRGAGVVQLEKARVRWFMSIDRADLPANRREGQTTWRSITIDGEELEFSEGFTDLHTRSYEEILAGRGYGVDDVRASVELVSKLRNLPVIASKASHPAIDRTGA